ncbi:ArdC-like ssDNA-binding domain-containing protein [Helicobacter pylori]
MKVWNEMDIKEQKEVFARFLASEIAKSLESGLEFKPNNRAYNGNAGNAYNGLHSLILDAKQHENGYESNVWVGLDDALKLGANPKEVEHIKNNTKSKNNPNGFYDKASIAYIRDYEMRYVKARDEQGNLIPLKDKEGNLKHYSNGEVIYENEKVPQRDKEGNIKYMQDGKTPFYEFKKEKIDIEPTLEIKNLYNVNVFQTLDKTKLKELDPKTLRTQYISNTFSMNNQNLVIYDLSKHLNEKQYNKVLDYVNQYGATHHEKRKQHKIYQEPQQQIAPNTNNNAKENNTKEPNNNEMNMAEFSKMKYDHYFANDEVVLTQSKGRGR